MIEKKMINFKVGDRVIGKPFARNVEEDVTGKIIAFWDNDKKYGSVLDDKGQKWLFNFTHADVRKGE